MIANTNYEDRKGGSERQVDLTSQNISLMQIQKNVGVFTFLTKITLFRQHTRGLCAWITT